MTITLIAFAAVFFAFFGWAVVRGGAIQEQTVRDLVFAEGIYDEVKQ
jgi:hypothetical protein